MKAKLCRLKVAKLKDVNSPIIARGNDGEFFILADHRNGGEDSRYYGAVRTEDLLGTVITVIRRNHL